MSGGSAARRVEKPWGYELIWAHTDRYAGHLIVVETDDAILVCHRDRAEDVKKVVEACRETGRDKVL